VISHKLKFIYIHIPKTGGSSLTMFLRDSLANKVTIGKNKGVEVLCESQRFPLENFSIKHEDIAYYHALYGDRIKDYYKFTIVRNPYDLIMSSYFYQTGDKLEFNKNKYMEYVKDFSFYMPRHYRQEELTTDLLFQPTTPPRSFTKDRGGIDNVSAEKLLTLLNNMEFRQYKFVTYKDKIDCNIIRYENFMEDLKQIECLKSYNFNNYPKINSGKHDNKTEYVAGSANLEIPQYARYYDEQLSELVYNKFKEDFDVFNYKKYNP
jgi:hypothetical protein